MWRKFCATHPGDTGRHWFAVCSSQLVVGDRYLSRRVAWELIQDTIAAAVGYLPAHTIIAMCTCPEGASCPRMKPNPVMRQELLRHHEVTAGEALRRSGPGCRSCATGRRAVQIRRRILWLAQAG